MNSAIRYGLALLVIAVVFALIAGEFEGVPAVLALIGAGCLVWGLVRTAPARN